MRPLESLAHNISAALAELKFVVSFLLYLGNAKGLSGKDPESLCAAHRDVPTNGISRVVAARSLKRPSWVWFEAYMRYAASRIISLLSSPAASARRIPLSDTKATNHLRPSSIKRHMFWTLRISSIGIGGRLLTPTDLSKYIPTNGFLRSSAYSEMAKLKTALMELITLLTLEPTRPLAIR